MVRKKVLGRGIEALIPAAETKVTAAAEAGDLRQVPLEEIVPNPFQPRRAFPREELEELARSIRAKGVLEPLCLRRRKKVYQVVYGERRLRAARLAGLKKAPAIIRELDDREMLEVCLVENIQRQDLNPLEEAAAYQMLIKRGASQGTVAKRVGKDRASVANSLRLLRLPPQVKELLDSGKLSMGHARAILALPTRAAMISLARETVRKGLSVRQVERLAGGGQGRKKAGGKGEEIAEIKRILDRLRQSLGTKVAISYRRGRGKVIIHYFSDQDLERVVELICKK